MWRYKIKEYIDGGKIVQFIPSGVFEDPNASSKAVRNRAIHEVIDNASSGYPLPFLTEEDRRIRRAHSAKCNARHAFTRMYDLLRSNHWSWFVTLTIDNKNPAAFDFDAATKIAKGWLQRIRNALRKKNLSLSYVMVYELTKAGAYHFHLLCSSELRYFLRKSIRRDGSLRRDNKGRQIYNVKNWNAGIITSATKVGDSTRAAVYVSKYVRKDLDSGRLAGKKRYWASRGLAMPTVTYTVNLPFSAAPIVTNPDEDLAVIVSCTAPSRIKCYDSLYCGKNYYIYYDKGDSFPSKFSPELWKKCLTFYSNLV